jgi:acyl-CoA synthetase (AMP-forming)/AMP-acid ligase II
MITTPFALISAYSTRFELVHALKLIKPTRLFVDAQLLNNILSAIQDPDVTLSADNVYILSGHVHGRKSLSQMIDIAQRTNIPLESIRSATSNTLAYLVMSSGTSGLPKGQPQASWNDLS